MIASKDEIQRLITDMRTHHGQWRYIGREPSHYVFFTTLPEQAIEIIEGLATALDDTRKERDAYLASFVKADELVGAEKTLREVYERQLRRLSEPTPHAGKARDGIEAQRGLNDIWPGDKI